MLETIEVRLARDRADVDTCVRLQRTVWGLSDLETASAIQLTTSVWAGALLHLAETPGGGAVGFAYAVPALRDGVSHFHSDMLAVLPAHQKHGVGERLKWAQRQEALARGTSVMTWIFDPMQARQAHLNLRRLGAVGTQFLPDFFGITSAVLHYGLPTDRLAVRWDLRAPRVSHLAGGGELPPTEPLPELPRINQVRWQAGWPVSSEPVLDLEEPELLLEIPPDWDVLSRSAPRLAQEWQARVHQALSTYVGARGLAVAGFVPVDDGGRRRPHYVLRRG